MSDTLTLAAICDGLKAALMAAPSLARGQAPAELTESVPDVPLLQVYPEEGTADPHGNNDRTTFQAGVRQTEVFIYADLYAQQRSHIGEDVAKYIACVDELIAIIEAQDKKPYFGVAGIKAFSWGWKRALFPYTDPNVKYVGARFLFRLRIF